MNIEQLHEYALSLPDVTESFPFDETTLVMKAAGKMFLLVSLDADPLQFNVKCDPERAIELREEYACILPGYHMNKKHWNTIVVDGTLTNKQLKEMVLDSYNLIVKKKKK
ncbi:MAG: MmcQ/YjbR family DNA-binding protein [Chitinophagales bacterium]|nr:MmcQ/YjbR family DNA-binding protein [Chitinophagales bacterium]